MNFREFLSESLLLEGGAALKDVESITQAEAKAAIPELIKKIAAELHVDKSLVKAIGSAGNKPDAKSLSGDIDIAVQIKPNEVDAVLPRLASDGKSYRAMVGINVFSFAYNIGKKRVQVDLIPVSNVEFARWSYMAHETDLAQGLKGAHRNELFFAVAKNADRDDRDLDEDDETDEIERYFYDLSHGLMRGTQSRTSPKGKLLKSFRTVEKNKLTDEPAEVTAKLFGDHVKPSDVGTFEGTLKAILSPKFPHANVRDEIIKMATRGMEKKGLSVPSSMAVDVRKLSGS